MVKVEILLSSLAAAACTATVGIAVWKLELGRPTYSDELRRQKAYETTTDTASDTSEEPENAIVQESIEEHKLSGQEEVKSPEKAPECPRGAMVPLVEPRREWRVGGPREHLLRSMTPGASKSDWDVSSDITEWSSVADDEEDRQVFDTPPPTWKSESSTNHRSMQKSTWWDRLGYGRYKKCT
ncbi:unnamed protein product [Phytophthora fragariaefolia]|uniref:Unnamed protein product n=1 Tax=Phytophthora fragariaefolia TaxID=1490495 RepID=A0A9W6XZJ6_9STRA|nr:unnamed protein product [Phytophthora fragariaefolia]